MAIRSIRKPYLLMVGDMENPVNAKTALGLRDWVPESCVGQFRFSPKAVDLALPDMSLRDGVVAGAKTLVVGIAPAGGQLPTSWHATLVEALSLGLDLAAGLHQRLSHIEEVAAAARKFGREIHDVRHSDASFSVGTGKKRSGRRLLTVGTDCALGKKYTALAIARAMRARGHDAEFRATGQTGILISGGGIAVDAVVADFLAGAAEALSPDNSPDHWDIIEGQGSLFHPAYAGVTLGLIHGSQPDVLVLCHEPTRNALAGFPHVRITSPRDAIDPYLQAAKLTNPNVQFVGASLNTSGMEPQQADTILRKMEDILGLPCFDPIRTGVGAVIPHLEALNDR